MGSTQKGSPRPQPNPILLRHCPRPHTFVALGMVAALPAPMSECSIKEIIPNSHPLPLLAQFNAAFSHPTKPHSTPCSCRPHNPFRFSVAVGSVSLP